MQQSVEDHPYATTDAAQDGGAPASLVSLRKVTKRYGDRVILDAIDLDVAHREKVALIGASGSGKTTILRLVMGLIRPDSGTIRIDDKYLWHVERNGRLEPAGERHARIARRPVGMVFQQFNLFPHMTAIENVREPMIQVLGLSREESDERAKEILSQVGLGALLLHRPAQLSGGQQQRVAIARSVALRPRVMLFDEVTSALDPELVGEVLRVLRDLAAATDMSMLIVTHEMSFAEDIANRVLMFDQGSIVEEGPPHRLLRQPTHPRTRQFLRALLER